MGRCKYYKSPSNIKRSARRLILHLHRIIQTMVTNKSNQYFTPLKLDTGEDRMPRDSSEIPIDLTSDTVQSSEQQVDSPIQQLFFTSSPKPLGIICERCRRQARRLLLEDVTWCSDVQATGQAALAAIYLLVFSATLWIVTILSICV